MASVISVPANGGLSVENEHNVHINRAGRSVTLTNAPITMNTTQKNQDKLPKDCEDVETVKGRYSWKLIAGHHVPYIIRVINGEQFKFVSVRMAESQLLSNYLQYLHADVYTCTFVKGHFITESEAKLLNVININHNDCIYGKEVFFAGKDYIVRLEDVHEFYKFIEVCYKKLLCNITPGRREKCGFIRINSSELVLPYCIIGNQKYVPLFYFEGATENLKHRAVKLENWNLAYLKFCCKVKGIRNDLIASDSCTVTSLDDIRNYFPLETNFEEYWPAELFDTHLLINRKSTHVNPTSAWIRTHAEVVPAENTIAHTLTAPAPLPPSMPVMMNTYQNGWPANQMGSTMSQGSSLVNNEGHFVPPPPLVGAGNTTPVIDNTVSYSNVVPISQCITTMYNPMTNDNVMSDSSQRSNNRQAQQQQQQQQQQIITTPQTRQPYSGQSVHGRLTNTQQRNALRNARPVVIAQPLESFDLSSPLSSHVPPAVQENPLRPNIACELTRIPERMFAYDTSKNAAYKIQNATLQGRMIRCINAKPYIYSDLMVTLDDLVQTVLPSCTVSKCAYILNKYLKTTIFSGNSEQLAVLRENGRIWSMYPDDTPMAMLQDVTHVWPQLKVLVLKLDEQIQQYYAAAAGGPAKRQRTS